MSVTLGRPLDLLLVEDSESDAELVVHELRRQGFEVAYERVDSQAALRTALGAGSWNVILCDHNLPGFDSRAALAMLREDDLELPFVVLSGTIGEEAAVEMLRAGARDVVLKDNLARLGPVIERELEEAIARAERKESEEHQARLEELLRQSQKMEAIGSLAAGVAHDFNNVLTAIRNASHSLLGRHLDEDARRRLHDIELATDHGTALTQQLLAFGRRQVLRPEPTDLSRVVESTLELVRHVIDERIRVERRLAADLSPVLIDRVQLQQVVLNLCLNAGEAMPDGGTLTVRTANVVLDDTYASEHLDVVPGPFVLLEITDTGVGMDAATSARVFEPFFTTKETGTGLGLATIYGIVKQSGGHVWLYTESGLGTTFRVYFPQTDAPLTEQPAAPHMGSVAGDETILLVEDAEIVRPAVAELLGSSGYTVLVAADGLEALAVSDHHDGAIDLLLTDVVMPRLNGRELAEKLTELRPGVKVVFTSGYPADSVIRVGIAESRVAYIQKPYVGDDLLRLIRATLDDA